MTTFAVRLRLSGHAAGRPVGMVARFPRGFAGGARLLHDPANRRAIRKMSRALRGVVRLDASTLFGPEIAREVDLTYRPPLAELCDDPATPLLALHAWCDGRSCTRHYAADSGGDGGLDLYPVAMVRGRTLRVAGPRLPHASLTQPESCVWAHTQLVEPLVAPVLSCDAGTVTVALSGATVAFHVDEHPSVTLVPRPCADSQKRAR